MSSLSTSLNDAVTAGQNAVRIDTAVLSKLMDLAGDLAINLKIAPRKIARDLRRGGRGGPCRGFAPSATTRP